MNGFDIALLGVLGIQAILGFQRGFVRIIFDIVAIAGGVVFGLLHYKDISVKIQTFAHIPSHYANFVAFIGIWLSIFVAVYLLSKLVNIAVTFTGLGLINRLGGFVLGATKGVFLVLPVIVPMLFLNVGIIENSRIIQPLKPYLDSMVDLYLHPAIQTTKLETIQNNKFSFKKYKNSKPFV